MHNAFKAVAAALKDAGYTKIDSMPASKREHENLIVGPVAKMLEKPRKGRALPARIPELIMDPKTKNFAALSILADAGLAWDDVHMFNGDLIIRNVPVPAAKPAPKKEPAKTE